MPRHAEGRVAAGDAGSDCRRCTRHAARALALITAVVLFAGCATTSQTSTRTEKRPSPALQQIAQRFPGEYTSVIENDRPTQSLSIARRSGNESERLRLTLVQRDAGADNVRRYGLVLESAAVENRLRGSFALLEAGGQSRRSCPMDFHLTDRGLVGETDPASCRFGEGTDAVGLLKEIAFDGRRISIGDRLVDPETGEPRGADRIIRFLPAAEFSGWLGVREGEEWRIARDFGLATGERVEPLDAADMSLGYAIGLHYYRMEHDGENTLMRLTVTRPESGEIVAESWAAPGSRTIGVALPDLQVGLNRPERGSSR